MEQADCDISSLIAKVNDAEVTNLDYFTGGLPPLAFLVMRIDEIQQLADTSKVESGLDFVSELCFIGLAAYFESFCKDQFSAIVNIVPKTLSAFSEVRDCQLPISSLLHILSNVSTRLGFVITEQYDFGSAKLVNGLFNDLIKITPFSKDEAQSYTEFLRDRNLLVHHGGVYTLKYAFQKCDDDVKSKTHFDSLVVNRTDIKKKSDFLLKIAKKIANASEKAVLEFVEKNKISLTQEALNAVQAFKWE